MLPWSWPHGALLVRSVGATKRPHGVRERADIGAGPAGPRRRGATCAAHREPSAPRCKTRAPEEPRFSRGGGLGQTPANGYYEHIFGGG